MRIFADKLEQQLSRSKHPMYLLLGNEPLLLDESKQLIAKTLQQAGFDEVHRFVADSSLDWYQVQDCFQALSLFSAQQLIEIEVPESGFNATLGKSLAELIPLFNQDTVLVVIGSKVTKAQENTKWFKTIAENACWVNCQTPELAHLPRFIQQRCHKLSLKPEPDVLQVMAQWHEGNLLALSQSLEKLALLYPDGELTLPRVEEALSRHNHFTVFNWVDAWLAGKSNRAQRIVRQLESEGIEAIILLRTLQKEINILIELASTPINQQASVYSKLRVWASKKPLYQSALQRNSIADLLQIVKLLANAERLAKTQYEDNCWPILQQISLNLCQASKVAIKA